MDFLKNIYERARARKQRIVLPEGESERVIAAAEIIRKQGLAEVILLCTGDRIEEFDRYAEGYYELREKKGITREQARMLLSENSVFAGAMMVRFGDADGMVAGAAYTTKNVARAVIHCIPREGGGSTVSGAFIVLTDREFGEDGVMVFADCAIVPEPSAEQLAEIAISSARLIKGFLGYEPRVAMLSYSTKGSASGDSVERVIKASGIVKEREPGIIIDGELQADTAIVPKVSEIKAPGSLLKGRANILIFPSLDAGNIACKLVQRFGNVRAIGPIFQGVRYPCSDLSRGCSVEDIVDTVAMVAVKAQG